MNSYTLTGIYLYPIKSMGGISLDQALVKERGLEHDRRWMLVDTEGRFMSQRAHPQMALFKVSLLEQALLLNFEGDELHIPMKPDTTDSLQVQIWDDTCEAVLYSDPINQWLGNKLGHATRLVYMTETSVRKVDPRYAQGETVSFSDGYPYLLISEASLDLLNSKLDQPVPMNRFRPNLVVSGSTAHEEDQWTNFGIGPIRFKGVKPCSRCVMTTIDQETSHKSAEPLKTLAGYRKINNKVNFGQNVLALSEGKISLGDKLNLL